MVLLNFSGDRLKFWRDVENPFLGEKPGGKAGSGMSRSSEVPWILFEFRNKDM